MQPSHTVERQVVPESDRRRLEASLAPVVGVGEISDGGPISEATPEPLKRGRRARAEEHDDPDQPTAPEEATP